MRKIHIDIIAPGNGKSYEFMFDDTIKIGKLLELAIAQITELESGNISFASDAMLCDETQMAPLSPELTAHEAGLRSGKKLFLV